MGGKIAMGVKLIELSMEMLFESHLITSVYIFGISGMSHLSSTWPSEE